MNRNKTLKNKDIYYCYDLDLAIYLRDVCKFPFICRALKKGTLEEFYLFVKSPALTKRANQFKNYSISNL